MTILRINESSGNVHLIPLESIIRVSYVKMIDGTMLHTTDGGKYKLVGNRLTDILPLWTKKEDYSVVSVDNNLSDSEGEL